MSRWVLYSLSCLRDLHNCLAGLLGLPANLL